MKGQPLYHQLTQRQLAAIKPGSSSYLFVGPSGSGRRLAAYMIAKRLNCPSDGSDNCAICLNIDAEGFADLHFVAGTPSVGIEQIQIIQQALAQRPFSSETTRVVIIDAEAMTVPAQNRLLKTLEEPPAQTIIVLIADQISNVLPTIQSRCQIVNFIGLPAPAISQYLETLVGSAQAAEIMNLKPDTIGQAIALSQDADKRATLEANLNLAQRFASSNLFERLSIAQSQKAKGGVLALINALANMSRQRLLPPRAFLAIEQAYAALNANVGPRTVMEALALAL